MDIRKKIVSKIEAQKEKIVQIKLSLTQEEYYLRGLEATVTVMPKQSGHAELRAGTLVASARDYLRKAGKPLHVSKILEGIGREIDRDNKVSLSGSISAYIRKDQVFTKTEPNTFGLKEFDKGEKEIKLVDRVLNL